MNQCGLTAPGNLGEIAQEVRELRDVNELENGLTNGAGAS